MRVHACLVTQNALLNLVSNVGRLLPHVDTVTVVDGGSIDGTIPLMRNWTRVDSRLRYFIRPGGEDALVRGNACLDRVAEVVVDGDWVLAVDPDEFLDEAALVALRDIARVALEVEERFVGFQCRTVTMRGPERVGQREDECWKVLFFRWSPQVRYAQGEMPLSGEDSVYAIGKRPEFPAMFYEHRVQEVAA